MTDPKVTRRRRMAAQRLDVADKALRTAWVEIGVAHQLLTGTGDAPVDLNRLASMRGEIMSMFANLYMVERQIQMKRAARGK